MKIFEVLMTLLEYDRAATANKLGPKLIQANQRDRVADLDKILEVLEACDPTRTKQYMMWIARQYIAGAFRLEDRPRVFDALTAFESLKRRLTQKDINQYTLSTLRQVIDDATTVGELGSAQAQTNAAGGFPVVPDSKVLYNGPLGQLSIPETEAASIALGKNTSWCTARKDDENQFDYFSSLSELYVWIDQRGKKYQFWFGNEDEEPQIKDSKDDDIPAAKLKQLVDSSPPLTKLINSKLKDPQFAVYWAEHAIEGRIPEAEESISKNLKLSIRYAQYAIKGRFPQAEPAIAQDPKLSLIYAIDVIGGRWPEGEKAIAQDPQMALTYASDVIRGRWPEGEDIISTEVGYSVRYASEVLGGRFPKGEPTIAKNAYASIGYADDVIRGRFPQAEPTILKDPFRTFEYARIIIKGRWPEAEKTLIKDPSNAFKYAQSIIKGRWPEAEPYIARDPNVALAYALYVIKGRWPEAEPYIAQDPFYAKRYAEEVWPKSRG
jgi:hypothetical protein